MVHNFQNQLISIDTSFRMKIVWMKSLKKWKDYIWTAFSNNTMAILYFLDTYKTSIFSIFFGGGAIEKKVVIGSLGTQS